jgi:hypothetical protein
MPAHFGDGGHQPHEVFSRLLRANVQHIRSPNTESTKRLLMRFTSGENGRYSRMDYSYPMGNPGSALDHSIRRGLRDTGDER